MEVTSLQFWGNLWLVLVGLALFVFMVLDGFDLGVGMLLPMFSRHRDHQAMAVNSIWPVWDGNELWGLVAAGGLLIAFPAVFNLILTGFYPFMYLFLAALMFRPVIFEIWFHSVAGRAFWQKMFALASFATIFLLGVVIGNLHGGMVLVADARGAPAFGGSLVSLLNPFAIFTGLLLAVACMAHGAAWLMIKLDGEARLEAKLALLRIWVILVIAAGCWLLLLFITLPAAAASPWVWILAALLAGDLVALRVLGGGSGEKRVFALTGLFFGLYWLMMLATQFPVMARASNNPGLSLYAGNAGGSLATMRFLGLLAPVVLVVVVGYTVFVYKIFKGKVKKSAHY